MTPTAYGPELAPPGVEIRWLDVAFQRPKIVSRLALLHTNGASGPASLQGTWNYANSSPSTTKPHYQVQRDGTAWKMLPSDRKGIANYKAADFGIALETQDLGWPTPGSVPYTPEQADTICRILAFEHITSAGRMPLAVPDRWDGAGVGSHTDPFGYPYWTNARGKPCPGDAKKAQLRTLILPLTARYVTEWTAPPEPLPINPPEVDMIILDWGITTMLWTGTALAWVENGDVNPVIERAELKRQTVNDAELLGIILCSRTTTRVPGSTTSNPDGTLTAKLANNWRARAA